MRQCAAVATICRLLHDGRDQRAQTLKRAEQDQQTNRTGLGQHIPAEYERLHLEGPGDRHVGGPLEEETVDLEGGECG